MKTLAAAVVVALFLVAPAQAQDAKKGSDWNANVNGDAGGAAVTLDAQQTELVKKVSGFFNEVKNLQGRFVQTGADNKRMRGKFYLKPPGRFRFDYALPSRQVIVSDGKLLAIQDLDLKSEDVVQLDQTPFRVLLRKDVDLLRDARILEVQEADDVVIVSLVDKSPDTPGKIRLFFVKKPAFELKEWVTTDAQGLETRVEVSELVRTEEISPDLFDRQKVGLLRAQ